MRGSPAVVISRYLGFAETDASRQFHLGFPPQIRFLCRQPQRNSISMSANLAPATPFLGPAMSICDPAIVYFRLFSELAAVSVPCDSLIGCLLFSQLAAVSFPCDSLSWLPCLFPALLSKMVAVSIPCDCRVYSPLLSELPAVFAPCSWNCLLCLLPCCSRS